MYIYVYIYIYINIYKYSVHTHTHTHSQFHDQTFSTLFSFCLQLSKFLSDIGGTLGLWLGMSILSIVEFIEFFVDLGVFSTIKLHSYCNKNKVNNSNSRVNQMHNKNSHMNASYQGQSPGNHYGAEAAGNDEGGGGAAVAANHSSASYVNPKNGMQPPSYDASNRSRKPRMSSASIDSVEPMPIKNEKPPLPSPVVQKSEAWSQPRTQAHKSNSGWQNQKTNQRNIAWQQQMAQQSASTPRDIDLDLDMFHQRFNPLSPPPPYSSANTDLRFI